jgi:hypothetical protein
VIPSVGRAFLDVETSGFSPRRHEILEIAVVVEHPGGGLAWSAGIEPRRLDQADEKALAVNRWRERYGDGRQLLGVAEALTCVATLIPEGAETYVWSPSAIKDPFDVRWLRLTAAEVWEYEDWPDFIGLQVANPAPEIAKRFGVPKLSLSDAAERLGVEVPAELHSALADALLLADVVRAHEETR